MASPKPVPEDVTLKAVPPPWQFVPNEQLEEPETPAQCAIADSKDQPVAIFMRPAECIRSIVCVNACNGIPTALLDGGILTTLTELLERYVNKDTCTCNPQDTSVACIKHLGERTLAGLTSIVLSSPPSKPEAPPEKGGKKP